MGYEILYFILFIGTGIFVAGNGLFGLLSGIFLIKMPKLGIESELEGFWAFIVSIIWISTGILWIAILLLKRKLDIYPIHACSMLVFLILNIWFSTKGYIPRR